ncbi:hypothetical protein F5Y17DRAFT_455380 [Xylariaceae sp. FL0594]|nr:hypothetical protein F5Y17DRAFT_455380 [Xylariaceae sp. FL0594]
MRWLTRLTRPSRGIGALLPHNGGWAGPNRACCARAGLAQYGRFPLCTSTSFLRRENNASTKTAPETSTSLSSSQTDTTRGGSPNSIQPKKRGANEGGSQWTLWAVIFTASAGGAYIYRRLNGAFEDDDDVINTSDFSSFTITRKEQISPSAFILTLRPSSWVDPKDLLPQSQGQSVNPGQGGEGIGFLSRRIQDAWKHGLWSVEIKQPQLQIARHYTPLPPLSHGDAQSFSAEEEEGEELEQADLRILIRRMDGGEMTNYLSRQRVGDVIWLRGPHLGFDVARRLGIVDANGPDEGKSNPGVGIIPRDVVFLAGGTGITPALQIAHKILDNSSSSSSSSSSINSPKPRVSILWANRHEVDAVGREVVSHTAQKKAAKSWLSFFWGDDSNSEPDTKQEAVEKPSPSSLGLQIQDLRLRHGPNFRISYFVDDEGSFIGSRDIEAAIASASASAPPSPATTVNKTCTWHSGEAVQLLPDENDAARSSSSTSTSTSASSKPDASAAAAQAYPCTCAPISGNTSARPGVNLLFVSGPEGFINAYAGPKRWHDGHEMQGAVGGLLGRLRSDQRKRLEGWCVLKL